MGEISDIGRRLITFREERDLRQEDLAEIIGVHQNTFSKYETGALKISITKLLKICHHFGLPDDYFLADHPTGRSTGGHIDIDAEVDRAMKELYPGHFGDIYSKGASKLFRSIIQNPAEALKLLDDDYDIEFKPKKNVIFMLDSLTSNAYSHLVSGQKPHSSAPRAPDRRMI